ncbi:MAG: sulfatase-like hydrolase/transferase, partial [Verrucomicrobiota bacterium]
SVGVGADAAWTNGLAATWIIGRVAHMACYYAGWGPARSASFGLSLIANEKPNIIFILADDLGYGDVAANNPASKIPTPAMDRLAAEGMRFTDAHSPSAVCTPTRYAILTGRYCWRTSLTKGVLNGFGKTLLEPERLTMPEMLREQGYATACVGKWHLGLDLFAPNGERMNHQKNWQTQVANLQSADQIRVENGPLEHGFDSSFILPGSLNMSPYAYVDGDQFTELATEDQPRTPHNITIISGGPKAPSFDFEAIIDVFNDKAEAFIREQAKTESPFFLYFPLTAPHKPVLPTPEFKDRSGYGIYGDFVMQVDDVVSRIDSVLEETGLTDNTLVIMTSDNGSFMFRLAENQPDHLTEFTAVGYHPKTHQSNHIWRGTKADIYEAGHRVPLLVRWSAGIEAGVTCDHRISLVDWFATFAEMTGHALEDNQAEDSFSLRQLLKGAGENWERAPVVTHSVGGMFAIADGKWKLIAGNGSGGRQSPKGAPFQRPFQLYDLEADPSETRNVIDAHPEIAKRLEDRLGAIRSSGRSR